MFELSNLLSMRGISKSFSGVRVLQDVNFNVAAGEVHVLAGENGAGKTTLMKILCGVHIEYEGDIFLKGKKTRFGSTADAAHKGISMIYQDMSLVRSMTVVDNIFLGRERAKKGIWMDHKAQQKMARSLLGQLDVDVELKRPVESYPISVQQMIEITKALAFQAGIVIMDEPTSALNQLEVERLFEIIGGLKQKGCGIIYISHKMEEIYRIGDRITVLRDGKHIGTARKEELSRQELIRWMVGREMRQQFPSRVEVNKDAKPRLEVQEFSVPARSGSRRHVAENVSLSVRAGEILGIAGLEGAGNHELLHGLFGSYGRDIPGRVFLDDKSFEPKSPGHSISKGMALLTNDRKGYGLVLGMSVIHNTTLASLARFSPMGWLRPEKEKEATAMMRETMNVHLRSLSQPVSELSGGNQQKVVLAKWLETQPKVLLLDEPSRGVDVGAKKEIYDLMNRWTEQGIAILLITSEMPELLAMSDRIIVMHRGKVTAEFPGKETTQESILEAAMGKD